MQEQLLLFQDPPIVQMGRALKEVQEKLDRQRRAQFSEIRKYAKRVMELEGEVAHMKMGMMSMGPA